jgi:Lrp/AsnC family transcriptional regulator for asnA, asnC and gidA
MINSLDREIIGALKKDGRYSFTRLAEQLNVNIATLTRHVYKLLEENIITIDTVINPFKLGYNSHAFICLNMNLSKINQVCSQLVDNFNISLVATTFGRYDTIAIADFPTWETLQEFVAKDLTQIDGIRQIDTFPITEIKKIYSVLFKKDSSENGALVLDNIDRIIIEELRKNGRVSYTEIGKKLNLNLTTVSRRISRLKHNEIINISAVRDPAKWGFLAYSYIAIHADKFKVISICNTLATYPEIHLVVTLLSGYEIIVGVSLHSPEEMYNFTINKLASIDGIIQIETFFCSGIRKRRYALFNPEIDTWWN